MVHKNPYDKNHYRVSPDERLIMIERFLPEKKRNKDKDPMPYQSRHFKYIEELIKICRKLMRERIGLHDRIYVLENKVEAAQAICQKERNKVLRQLCRAEAKLENLERKNDTTVTS